jgi:hypothetical protein
MQETNYQVTALYSEFCIYSQTFSFFTSVFFSLYCWAVWKYIVAYTKVLTGIKYILLEFTPSTTLLHHPTPNSWNSFNRYHYSFIYMYTHYLEVVGKGEWIRHFLIGVISLLDVSIYIHLPFFMESFKTSLLCPIFQYQTVETL